MSTEHRLIAAVAILALGVILGEIAGRIVRGSMSRPGRSKESREMARPVAAFVFWVGTTIGILLAASFTSRDSLEEIPTSAYSALPHILLAWLVVLAGYAVAIGVSAGIAQSFLRSSGVRHRGLERGARYVVIAVSVGLALTQLGVDTTVLSVAMGLVVGVPALTLGAMTALGSRHVAAEIAAGRAVRGRLRVGHYLVCSETEGIIIAVHPVSVEVDAIDGRQMHVPFHCLVDHPYSVQPTRRRDGASQGGAGVGTDAAPG